jgi:hypothetical protein
MRAGDNAALVERRRRVAGMFARFGCRSGPDSRDPPRHPSGLIGKTIPFIHPESF